MLRTCMDVDNHYLYVTDGDANIISFSNQDYYPCFDVNEFIAWRLVRNKLLGGSNL